MVERRGGRAAPVPPYDSRGSRLDRSIPLTEGEATVLVTLVRQDLDRTELQAALFVLTNTILGRQVTVTAVRSLERSG